ncbi:MAG: threonine dehydratase [Congregibacter sp.]
MNDPQYEFSLSRLEAAAALVYREMPATPQYAWPTLRDALGIDLWVKHENHTPTGAFKIRGGISFIHWLKDSHPDCRGIVTATRGNHGQSQARAASKASLTTTIVVPHKNASEKNDAMRAFGATLIEHGADFDEARAHAQQLAVSEDLYLVPSFHSALVSGVASYALELFRAVPDIDSLYVPIGCGSGICAVIAARDALGLTTEIIGVVSEAAPAAARAFASGQLESTASARTFADGVAVRSVVPDALAIYQKGASRVVEVSDDAIADAIRMYFRCTHNVAEGAGAAPLAALIKERDAQRGKRVAVILCGGNIDSQVFETVLSGRTPEA